MSTISVSNTAAKENKDSKGAKRYSTNELKTLTERKGKNKKSTIDYKAESQPPDSVPLSGKNSITLSPLKQVS